MTVRPVRKNGNSLLVTLTEELRAIGLKEGDNAHITVEDGTVCIKPFRRPYAPLIGVNENVFNLIGIAVTTLEDQGLRDLADELARRAVNTETYAEAVGIICSYVEPRWTEHPETDPSPEYLDIIRPHVEPGYLDGE